MRLDPQPKPVRIRLSIDQQNGSGKIVYFGLDDLLKNFDFESLVPHIVDQSLMRWLDPKTNRYNGLVNLQTDKTNFGGEVS